MNVLDPWSLHRERYEAGGWRAPIFRDMVVADLLVQGPRPTVLDIGCGDGFDGDVQLQRSIAHAAGRFIGIEPDRGIALGEYFAETHRCLFEDASVPSRSVDLAYAIMVLEHVLTPQVFWDKLHEVLVDGGVFWGMTVDARHPFAQLSLWAGRLGIKDRYLDIVLGRTQEEGRYRNYPTYYRSNTPDQISHLARGFRSHECINFARVGQLAPYLPMRLQTLANRLDRVSNRMGCPGTLLFIRAVK